METRFVCAGKFEFCSIVENNHTVAVRGVLKFLNGIDVDNNGAVNTQEYCRVKSRFQYVHPFPQEIGFLLRMDFSVISIRFYPINVLRFYDDSPPT